MRVFPQRMLLLAFYSLISISIITAQTLCPTIVEDALEAVSNNCAELGRNEACYGYDRVEASFLVDVADDYFTQAADFASVAELSSIRTAPLNSETGTWGIAVMNLQANLPNTIPGQNVTFILLGDVEVENAVAAEDAFQPSDGVEVRVNIAAGANLRSGAGTNFNVVAGLMNGETILVDGYSEDGEWLRTVYNNRPAWISVTVIDDSNPALRELPTLSPDLHTPMQAFYLRTGIGQPECTEALDNSLFVQGPENIEIEITVNGANISLGSSGILRVIEEDEQPYLEITVLDGTFKVDEQSIHAGQRSLVCLGDEASRGLDGAANDFVSSCPASQPERIDTDTFCNFENLPEELLHYSVEVLCAGENVPVVTSAANQDSPDSQLENVSCESFSLLSPLSPVNSGTHTFEWTAVEGENIRYDLVFYNQGVEVNVFSTAETSYTLNLGGDTATGGSFQWEVRAFSNEQYACVTFRSPELVRTGELDGTGGGGSTSGGFTATLSCTGSYVATATFSGATNGGNVALT